MELGGFSATGPRETNEDSFLTFDLSGSGSFSNDVVAFAMVSDGMGGYQGGDVASGLAVSCAKSYLQNLMEMARGNLVELDAGAALVEIAQNAHEAIILETQARGNTGMGATFIGAFVSRRHAWIGHVGDSRAYVVHKGEARQVTEDHSQVGRMLSRGLITEAEAQNHPARNRIERALGFPNSEPEITEVDLGPGDVLLLCSDGVYTVLGADAIGKLASVEDEAENVACRIVKSALSKGTDDNSTAVVIRIEHGVHAGRRKRTTQPTLRVDPMRNPASELPSSESPVANRALSKSFARGDSYSRMAQKNRSKWPTVVTVIAIAVIVVVAIVATFYFLGKQSGDADGALRAIDSSSAAEEAVSIENSGDTAVFKVEESASLKYVDQAGVAHSFNEDPPLNYAPDVKIKAGVDIMASGSVESYGRDYKYRKLDDKYLSALLNDCDYCKNGASYYSSDLSKIINMGRYKRFISSLVENEPIDIKFLVVRSDCLGGQASST